jgi:hypothetical protein
MKQITIAFTYDAIQAIENGEHPDSNDLTVIEVENDDVLKGLILGLELDPEGKAAVQYNEGTQLFEIIKPVLKEDEIKK